ncbi:Protein of unknown function [Pyronema omphalodes CBS 100304]|uniref:Uncharacterized protein n=1 Tax=Pyronema omphalodes (strain CBS 100304) TaxID=1076935 RepID=U4LSD1_PYROM|nr:Protein of unknown function [Pyronema omphalodes CBS 100304]
MSSASSSAFPRLPCTRMELTVHDMPNHRSQPISPQSILLDFSRLPKIAIIYQILNENTLQRQPIGFGVLNTTLETKPAWNRLIGGRRIAGRANVVFAARLAFALKKDGFPVRVKMPGKDIVQVNQLQVLMMEDSQILDETWAGEGVVPGPTDMLADAMELDI